MKREGVSKSTPSLFSTKPRLSQAGALLLPKDFVSLSLKIYTYGKDTHLSYWEQNIEIIFRISLLEKVNNALIVDKEKRVNRVLRHTLPF
ncbi:hypothetical protein [Bacteroides togonis]|uniref:hypothetical protein n=1 Tax=Bacteroides togonis TaxID=1917883 RepID=UPI00094B0DDE|nr:hypothetical protein [Bacteroides togonis]